MKTKFEAPLAGSRAFITGIDGLIGYGLAKRLLSKGVEIYGLVEGVDPAKPLHTEGFQFPWKRVKLYTGDIRDRDLMERINAEVEPAYVFHLAAVTQVPFSSMIQRHVMDVNVMGTVNVLEELCGGWKFEAAVFGSTDKVYGHGDVMYNEGSEFQPFHPYDTSKMAGDIIARGYAKFWEEQIGIVRTCNVYGPGDTNWNRVVPGALRAMIEDKPFYLRSNGMSVREYAFVGDVADAYIAFALELESGRVAPGTPLNITWQRRYRVVDVLEACRKATGRSIDWMVENIRIPDQGDPSEADSLKLSNLRQRLLLGDLPETSFIDGLRRTVAWMEGYLRA